MVGRERRGCVHPRLNIKSLQSSGVWSAALPLTGTSSKNKACACVCVRVRMCVLACVRDTVVPAQQSSVIKWLVKEQRSALIEYVQHGGFKGPSV